MGRKQKYITNEQQLEARKQRQLKYYYKNRQKINKSRMEDYWRRKEVDTDL
jgi:actin-related protein